MMVKVVRDDQLKVGYSHTTMRRLKL